MHIKHFMRKYNQAKVYSTSRKGEKVAIDFRQRHVTPSMVDDSELSQQKNFA